MTATRAAWWVVCTWALGAACVTESNHEAAPDSRIPTRPRTAGAEGGAGVEPDGAAGAGGAGATDGGAGGGGGIAGECPCSADRDCVTRTCVDGLCGLASCTDGVLNGREVDVDCGGPDCAPCAAGGACSEDADCATGACACRMCWQIGADACRNGARDQDETGVDCGGSACAPCDEDCCVPEDCPHGSCRDQRCWEPDCEDGLAGAGETDVDCGGGSCPPCAPDLRCLVDADCDTARCTRSDLAAACGGFGRCE